MKVSVLTLLVLASPLASSGLSTPRPSVWTSSAFKVAPAKDLFAVPDLLVQRFASAPQVVRSSEFKSSAFAGYPSASQISAQPIVVKSDGYLSSHSSKSSHGSKAAQSSQPIKVSGHKLGGFEKRAGSRGEDQLTINVNISGVTSESQPLTSSSLGSQSSQISLLGQTFSSSSIETPLSTSVVTLTPLATGFDSQTAGVSGSLEITGSQTSSGSVVSTESSESLGSTGSLDLSLSSQPSASIESSGSSGSVWVDSSSSGSQISGSSISVTSITSSSSSSSEASAESSEKGNKIFAAYKPASTEPGFSPSIENPIYTRYIAYEEKKQESSGFPNSVVLVSGQKTSSVEKPLLKTGEPLN